MNYSEVAYRYGTALFDCARDEGALESVVEEIRAVASGVFSERTFVEFIRSPLATALEKEAALKSALQGQKISETSRDFILLLAKKDRLQILDEIVLALDAKIDELKKVSRGTVRSGAPLSDQQKEELAKNISNIVGKTVILSYEIDATLVGGLTAKVGSLTFDDSISAHLHKLQENLNRRAH